MSKFINAIQTQLLGQRPIYPSLSVSTVKEFEAVSYDTLAKYLISVSFEQIITCRPEELSYAKDNVVKELREIIYGEFRDNILQLERAVYARDEKVIFQKIGDIMQEVFN